MCVCVLTTLGLNGAKKSESERENFYSPVPNNQRIQSDDNDDE